MYTLINIPFLGSLRWDGPLRRGAVRAARAACNHVKADLDLCGASGCCATRAWPHICGTLRCLPFRSVKHEFQYSSCLNPSLCAGVH